VPCDLPLLTTLVGDSGVLILSLARSRANETLEFVRKAGAKLVITLLLSLEITRPPQPSLKKVRAVVNIAPLWLAINNLHLFVLDISLPHLSRTLPRFQNGGRSRCQG
jgi:hypothetical protein